MSKSKWKFKFGISLIVIASILYFIHYLIFKDAHHMFLFLVEDIAFIPVEVLIVSLILHRILENREKQHILDKLNMIIGVFFSEVGTGLLNSFVQGDKDLHKLGNILNGIEDWSDKEFDIKAREINNHNYEMDMEKVDMDNLFDFLVNKRNFLVGLMQNPSLLEHETFTELLRTVFHLEDELQHRKKDEGFTKDDIDHLKNDIERVYPHLVYQWIIYMKYLKNNHPYLFALATKDNPFK